MVRQAMRCGAYDYILKPFSVDEIMFSVNRVIDRLKLIEEKKKYIISHEQCVNLSHQEFIKVVRDSMSVVYRSLADRGSFEPEHSRNIFDISLKIVQQMNWDEK